ncbi:hypothetical protein AVEN_105009-1 [Araneus ventricosus]|uniref:Uncharacterized protein n=1 Tax=Araneus ventricosus TaxID=182803 RepID=A0A4Y2TY73_ARAVE|nr:hypothetical protein AVEN_105009-1 [Araneus ventricosus]
MCQTCLHGCSSLKSGFEPGTSGPKVETLPPGHYYLSTFWEKIWFLQKPNTKEKKIKSSDKKLQPMFKQSLLLFQNSRGRLFKNLNMELTKKDTAASIIKYEHFSSNKSSG